MVFRRIDVETYHISKKVGKVSQKAFALHLHVLGRDIMGHMTSSLHAKMACFVWTDEEAQKFSHVIKAKNTTIGNISVLTANKSMNRQMQT